MQKPLTQDQVLQRIDEISALARERAQACSPTFVSALGGAGMDFLSSRECHQLHLLKLQLPTQEQMRTQAQERIAARIAARKAARAERDFASSMATAGHA